MGKTRQRLKKRRWAPLSRGRATSWRRSAPLPASAHVVRASPAPAYHPLVVAADGLGRLAQGALFAVHFPLRGPLVPAGHALEGHQAPAHLGGRQTVLLRHTGSPRQHQDQDGVGGRGQGPRPEWCCSQQPLGYEQGKHDLKRGPAAWHRPGEVQPPRSTLRGILGAVCASQMSP